MYALGARPVTSAARQRRSAFPAARATPGSGARGGDVEGRAGQRLAPPAKFDGGSHGFRNVVGSVFVTKDEAVDFTVRLLDLE